MSNRPRTTRPRRHGLSIVEATICIVLVSGLLAAAVGIVGATARLAGLRCDRSRAAELARYLLSEIQQCAYEEPDGTPLFGREFGEADARDTWDDVDDYHGLDARPVDRAGAGLPGSLGYRWQVAVALADPQAPLNDSATDQKLKRITVTVTDPRGRQTALTAWRSRHSTGDQRPDVPTEYLTGVDIRLRIGPDAAGEVAARAALLNPVPQ